MDLKNCTKCGRIFSYAGSQICSRCSTNDEDDYKKVKDYLYDHPGSTISEVSEGTGVTEKQILRYLRENKIEVRDDSNFIIDCERCGVPIKSGRFCDKCVSSMQKEFMSVLKPKTEEKKIEPSKQSNRMFVAEMRKKNK